VKSDEGGGFLVRVARRFLPVESMVGSMAPGVGEGKDSDRLKGQALRAFSRGCVETVGARVSHLLSQLARAVQAGKRQPGRRHRVGSTMNDCCYDVDDTKYKHEGNTEIEILYCWSRDWWCCVVLIESTDAMGHGKLHFKFKFSGRSAT
jgi:hypothetical protein